ncbi:TonB-dependent siderophore receptor [Acidovorax sp. CF316]|uniref:TonB-dependent receptor n=1 Tax=Acidovorax sp. CF316 TaxID=1144317 RepID=UPI00026BD310|nr:TonB-dependent receptor [Acidovorax sp. CF316]EJE53979.1 TonB-dependent siderophore receptor [Acidovorax sp. CF316]
MTSFKRSAVALAAAAAMQGALAQATEAELPAVNIQAGRDEGSLQLSNKSSSASRLGLTLRETPASVEILSQDLMQERGARTLSEALRSTAGMAGGGPPSAPTTLSLRGFTNVLYLYDGVRMSGAGVTNRVEDTWNYERIEVLKGPASVLQGDSAIGGIVNFQTKRPDRNNPGREALLSYGSYGSTRAAVGLGGAVGETGAYRLDYSRNDTRVGTIARTSEKLEHLTTGLSFDVARATRLDLSFDYSRDEGHAYWGTPLIPGSLSTQPTLVVSTPDGRVIDRRVAQSNYNILDDRNQSEAYWLRARITSRVTPEWTLRNEFTANKVERLWRNAESAVFTVPGSITRDQTLIAHDQRYLANRLDASHEGRIGALANKLVVGGEVSKTDFDNTRRFSNGSASTNATLRVPLFDPAVGTYNDDPALMAGGGNRTNFTSDVHSSSVFAEDALKLTKAWTLVGGLRHDRVDVDRSVTDLNLGTFSAFGTKYSANSVRLGTVYDLSSESSVYAQYTNATIPVGSLFLLSAGNAVFPQSKGKQFEVGFKQSTGDVEWTAAAYHIGLDNVLSRDANNANLTVNNGSQSSRGVEFSAAWRATKQLTLSGNVAALDARFDSLVEAGGVSRVGNTPPNVPERVANLFASYRFKDLPLNLLLSVNHTGKMYTDNANQIRINGHTTADLAASYRLKPALLSFRIRNLTDKLYASYAGRATSQVLLAPQRSFELSARVDF